VTVVLYVYLFFPSLTRLAGKSKTMIFLEKQKQQQRYHISCLALLLSSELAAHGNKSQHFGFLI
jgi:hypothetical protein